MSGTSLLAAFSTMTWGERRAMSGQQTPKKKIERKRKKNIHRVSLQIRPFFATLTGIRSLYFSRMRFATCIRLSANHTQSTAGRRRQKSQKTPTASQPPQRPSELTQRVLLLECRRRHCGFQRSQSFFWV
jgi:hypothetical protein